MVTVKKTKGNIRNKVLLILCAVLSLTVIGNFVISGEIFKKAQVSSFDNEAFATSRGLQNNINNLIEKSFLSYTEIVNCKPLLDSFVENNENVLYVYTTDAKGVALYSSENAIDDVLSSERLELSVLSGAEECIENKENETLYYILPLWETGKIDGEEVVSQVGVLVVAYPRACITEPQNRLYTSNAILAGVTFICSFLLIYLLLTRWITRPLQRLDEAIRKVSKKGFAKKNVLDIRTNDEIGQIAQSFNDMLEQLDVTTVSKNYVDSILLNMSEALFVIDLDMHIEKVNDAAMSLLGYTREEMQGKTVDMLYSNSNDNPFANKNFAKESFLDTTNDTMLRNNETEFVDRDGKVIAVSVNWSTIKDDTGNISRYVCTARDITEIKKAQSIVMHQANYDELTGLFNRYNLEQSIEKILNDSDKKHIFIVIDLDKFKVVNDVCGHAAGDELLKQIAYMLKIAAGESNLVARLGGDEFAIIMYDTDKKQMTNVIETLLKDIRNFNFTWDGKVFNVGMSIGAFEINRPGLDRLTVFTSADRACYIAKEQGGNRLHIYSDKDKESNEREEGAAITSVISEAFENSRFFLVYQPIVSFENKDDVYMYELLVRLRTKEGRVIKPGAFLSSAERYGKLMLLDKWTIHNFCANYHDGIEKLCQGHHVQFNINLTKESITSESFFDYVCQEFEEYMIPPDIMCFEFSENCVISNFTEATTLMKKFRNLGCKLAIDNFGMGMSSFMYLRLLPVDTIKIDGGFIREIDKSPLDVTVVRSINEIAHLLNLKTVAEWVENEQILEKVRELGIDYAQGYGIMRPGDFEEIVKR